MTTEASRVVTRFARTAALSLDPAVFREIAELTSGNNHTEANLLGAKVLRATKLVKKLELILKLQDLEGGLPMALGQYRYGLYKELMELAKRALSPEDYEKFHGSY